MTGDPERHHRRSIRLKGYDYAQAGAYFVTVCTQDRACIFGDVVDGVMYPNDAGRMVQTVWDELSVFYPDVDTDGFVVMPNHIHGIVVLVGAGPRACPSPRGHPETGQPPGTGQARGTGRPQGVAPTGLSSAGLSPTGLPSAGLSSTGVSLTGFSLADVVSRFKTMTTKRYADGVKQLGWPPFRGRLWQRNYYEHIIRNEAGLNRIRRYIDENPSRWASDEENPQRVTS